MQSRISRVALSQARLPTGSILRSAHKWPRGNVSSLQVAAVTRAARFSTSGKLGEGSHSDFQKQSKTSQQQNLDGSGSEKTEIFDVQQWLGQVVKEHPVVLFMKGSPDSPKCGFSASVVNVLNEVGCEFASADVLENDDVRSGLKVFSNWPTFPQLYIGGEFIGGADIIRELHKTDGLKPLLKKVGAVKTE